MKPTDFLPYMDKLYKTALIKTRDESLAEDLVQETYLYALQALSKGAVIEKPGAYLQSILQNRFFMHLRGKYKLSTVYFGDIEIAEETDFGELERSQDAETVRRELAFLSYTYREVMIRYYMKNQPVGQIAAELSIPKGTVLSRLDVGRKKIKEGVEKMDTYKENSYQPEILKVGMNGRTGQGGEPFTCIKNSLDENILLIAYEKPITVSEISRALGTPMAFIEESVNNLVDAQLMTRHGTKVATDFIIKSLEDYQKALDAAKDFAKASFDKVNAVILNGVKRYEEIPGFSAFNATQKYICAAVSMRLNIESRVYEAVTGKEELSYKDFPDRPNYGKWILLGSRFPHGFDFNDERGKYNMSGRYGSPDVNENISFVCEWDSPIGPTHFAKFKYSLKPEERARLIDAVRTNTVTSFQAELLPEMEHYGFIKDQNGTKVPAIPYITNKDEKTFFHIEGEMGDNFCKASLEDAAEMCKSTKISYPKHLTYVDDPCCLPIGYLPMAYVYEAAKRGIISIEEGKFYPVMYLISSGNR